MAQKDLYANLYHPLTCYCSLFYLYEHYSIMIHVLALSLIYALCTSIHGILHGIVEFEFLVRTNMNIEIMLCVYAFTFIRLQITIL